jgi:hypothetical protein
VNKSRRLTGDPRNHTSSQNNFTTNYQGNSKQQTIMAPSSNQIRDDPALMELFIRSRMKKTGLPLSISRRNGWFPARTTAYSSSCFGSASVIAVAFLRHTLYMTPFRLLPPNPLSATCTKKTKLGIERPPK